MSNIEDDRFQTGIFDYLIDSEKLSFYPNPFIDYTTIRFQNLANSRYRIKIRDITGKLVFSRNDMTGEEILLHKGALEAGIYYIELAGEKIFTGRMVIQ